MRTQWTWAYALLVPAFCIGADETAHTIKIKTYPDEGQSILCREVDKQQSLFRFLDADGKTIKEDKPLEESEEVFLLTVVEAGDKVPRRYRQTFEKAVSSTPKDKQRSYQGATIEYVLRGRKYRLELPEKPVIEDMEKDELAGRANSEIDAPMDEVFLPGKPVKVGDNWKVDPQVLRRGFGHLGQLDAERTEGTANLAKVYEKDGKRFGVIEINLTVAYAVMGELRFDPPALFDVKGTLDTAIDGTSNVGVLNLTTRLKGRTTIEQKGVKLTMQILREGTTIKERSVPR